MFGQTRSMIGFTQEQQPGAGRASLIGRANLDSPIEPRLK